MATTRHSTPHDRPAFAVRVGDQGLGDAVGEIRHTVRILTLAIMGFTASPHDVHGGRPYDQDDNWGHDLELLAFELVNQIDAVDTAVNAGGAS